MFWNSNRAAEGHCAQRSGGVRADGAGSAETPLSSEPAQVHSLVPLLPYQCADVESTARFRWNCWARQTGKSFTKSLRRILRGLERRRDQIFLSAGERQARELMDKARRHCQALQIVCDFHEEGSLGDLSLRRMEIKLPRGVRIIALPANPQTARGFSGDVLLDEFAMHADDRDIWAAMFPSLLRCDGELDVASTPRGCGNLFHQLRDNPRFSTSTVTLRDAIAQGLEADEAAIREAMDDDTLFRQEFLCEFLDESTAFLTYAQIAACVDAGLVPAKDVESLQVDPRELFVGVDVGRYRDLTVVWVLAKEADRLVTAGLFELAGATFSAQEKLLCDILRLPQVRRCCMDAGGLGMQLAEQAAERFGAHRVQAVTMTAALKSQLAGGLRIEVEKGRIRIPGDERIRKDWHSIRRHMSTSGHFVLDAPRREGSHADRFWAAALGLHAAGGTSGWDGDRGRAEAVMGTPLAFARTGSW